MKPLSTQKDPNPLKLKSQRRNVVILLKPKEFCAGTIQARNVNDLGKLIIDNFETEVRLVKKNGDFGRTIKNLKQDDIVLGPASNVKD